MSNHASPRSGGHRERGNRYLETAVSTASPAKLRLMLIERAAEVAGGLAASWRQGKGAESTQAASLKLLELLNELLGGVTSSGDPELSHRVADLYVFLIQHLLAAEESNDSKAADEIATVLQIEAETWRAVCARESAARPGQAVAGQASDDRPHASSGLNLHA